MTEGNGQSAKTVRDLADMGARVAALERDRDVLHARIDKMQVAIQDDLKTIKSDVRSISDWMHQRKGAAAFMALILTAFGAIVATAVNKVWPN